MADPFAARAELRVERERYTYYRLAALTAHGAADLARLPYSLRILLESLLRSCDERAVTREQVLELAAWQPRAERRPSLPYRPARVIMQDLTGVPAVVDLGAMRAAMARLGGDPAKVNPQAPTDLVIDHSVQVDHFGSADALSRNAAIEFRRNRERFEFLHWGQSAFANFRVVPPATGIVHQVNLEYLASVVMTDPSAEDGSAAPLVYPDTLVGTDSHTTMINGLGVLGWGVGGIEAEAAHARPALRHAGARGGRGRLTGARRRAPPPPTSRWRSYPDAAHAKAWSGKFVEFFGPGLASMSAAGPRHHRQHGPGVWRHHAASSRSTTRRCATCASSGAPRAPRTGRGYCKEQGLFRTADAPEPRFSELLELDLGSCNRPSPAPSGRRTASLLPAVQRQFRASARRCQGRNGASSGSAADRRAAPPCAPMAQRHHSATERSWSSPPSPPAPTLRTRR